MKILSYLFEKNDVEFIRNGAQDWADAGVSLGDGCRSVCLAVMHLGGAAGRAIAEVLFDIERELAAWTKKQRLH